MTTETGLLETLGNKKWLIDNADKIKSILPVTWTHMQNISLLSVGYQLKVLGVDWRSEQELAQIMVYLEKIGLLLRDGLTVRAAIR